MKPSYSYLLILLLSLTLTVYGEIAQESVDQGNAKSKMKDSKGAIADFTKAIQIDPKDEYIYYAREFAKENPEDHTGAIADYTKAIEIDPKNGVPY
jgi:tetratricopeptide (TPR) repeat protein